MKKTVETPGTRPVHEQAVEIVERKGTGHPDYICDSVMERISIELCREYMKRFGQVLHHNTDKPLLVAGQVEKGFGRGRVIKPMELIIGDRASFGTAKAKVPVVDIARKTVRSWFRENLPHVDPIKHLKIRTVLQPGSEELTDIFRRDGRVRGANDTSAAAGYAPLTPTERAVFETERFINSPAFKLSFPEAGEDVKVMGVRRGRALHITVACPLLALSIRNESAYFRKKQDICDSLMGFLSGFPFTKITLNFNSLDIKGHGTRGVYLSLLGTSAEDADSGQAGRGHRVNGVISLNRPMGTEAAAGKNPVSHVGKIYSILSHRMAEEVSLRVEGLKEVSVWLLSEIGRHLDEPSQVYIQAIPAKRHDRADIKKSAHKIIDEFLSGLPAFTQELSRGEHPVC